MGLSPEQIIYLRDVLGIEGVIVPTGAAVPPVDASAGATSALPPELRHPSAQIATPLSLVRQTGDLARARMIALAASRGAVFPREGEATDLSNKMIQAMKLAPSEVLWVEWTKISEEHCPHEVLSVVDAAGSKPVLVFGDDTVESLLGAPAAIGSWIEWNGVRIMPTHGLQALLKNANLKRESWVHLQMIMKVL